MNSVKLRRLLTSLVAEALRYFESLQKWGSGVPNSSDFWLRLLDYLRSQVTLAIPIPATLYQTLSEIFNQKFRRMWRARKWERNLKRNLLLIDGRNSKSEWNYDSLPVPKLRTLLLPLRLRSIADFLNTFGELIHSRLFRLFRIAYLSSIL